MAAGELVFGFDLRSRFHPKAVRKRAQRANFTNLRHAAAAIRLTARRRIRRRKTASRPGQAPHTRQGQLRRSILYQVDRAGSTAVIGPSFQGVGRSAQAHEFGGRYRGRHYPQRPFMAPALDDNRHRLPRYWRTSIR